MNMKIKLAIAFLAASSPVVAQSAPNINLGEMQRNSDTLKNITDTSHTYEVIWANVAARGSDPTQWAISPKAAKAILVIRATPTPGEQLDYLRVKLDRLHAQMRAYGYRFTADGLVCLLAPDSCALDEDRAAEVQDLGILIANTRREIDVLQQSSEVASRYSAAMKALHVPAPGGSQYEVTRSISTPHGSDPTPASPVVQAKTLQDCSPVWESHTSWILTPKMVGYNHAGDPQYVYQYQPVKNEVARYPAGCN